MKFHYRETMIDSTTAAKRAGLSRSRMDRLLRMKRIHGAVLVNGFPPRYRIPPDFKILPVRFPRRRRERKVT